jgi:hypothetical protein
MSVLSQRGRRVLAVALRCLALGCAAPPERRGSLLFPTQELSLECRGARPGTPCLTMSSLTLGELVDDPRRAELSLYFDGDDCSGGALVGRDDQAGWLFPLPASAWVSGAREATPSEEDSVPALTPLSALQPGDCFAVRAFTGRYALVRVLSVEDSNYGRLLTGGRARVVLEWRWWDLAQEPAASLG